MIDEAKLEKFAAEFPWIDDEYSLQHVWSSERNAIDTEFYFDECLRTVGDCVRIEWHWGSGGIVYVLSVGDYLYFAPASDIDRKSKTALLRRAPVKNVEMVDVDKIKIRRIN